MTLTKFDKDKLQPFKFGVNEFAVFAQFGDENPLKVGMKSQTEFLKA